MTKQQAISNFIRSEVAQDIHTYHIMQRCYIESNINYIEDQIMNSVECLQKQLSEIDSDMVSRIYYINYAMVRVNFFLQQPLFEIEVFGELYLLEDPRFTANYHPSWATERIYSLYEILLRKARKYQQNITKIDVDKIMLIELCTCLELFQAIIEQTLKRNQFHLLGLINGDMDLQIEVGNYRGLTKPVWDSRKIQINK